MEMKTPCLGAHSGSLKKTLVAWTHNLGAPGARKAAALLERYSLIILILRTKLLFAAVH